MAAGTVTAIEGRAVNRRRVLKRSWKRSWRAGDIAGGVPGPGIEGLWPLWRSRSGVAGGFVLQPAVEAVGAVADSVTM